MLDHFWNSQDYSPNEYSLVDLIPITPELEPEFECGCVDCGGEAVVSCPERRDAVCAECFAKLPRRLLTVSSGWRYIDSTRAIAWVCAGPSTLATGEGRTIQDALAVAQVKAWRPLMRLLASDLEEFQRMQRQGPGVAKAYRADLKRKLKTS
jgi:hypothetical protein